MNPSVYIIVLNWRNAADSIQCLEAVLALDYPNFRCVFVDNASGDGSLEKVQSAFGDRLDYIASPNNGGFSAGNNHGIRRAVAQGYDFVWLLNNDTIPYPDALSQLVQTALSDPKLGCVGSILLDFLPPHNVQAIGGGSLDWFSGQSKLIKAPSQHLGFVSGASNLIRCKVFEEIGLWDERYFLCWEDTDFSVMAHKQGWKLGIAKNSRILHKESATRGAKSTLSDFHEMRSLIKFFRKHSRVSVIPISLTLVRRSAKRLALGQWKNLSAVLRGFIAGYQ